MLGGELRERRDRVDDLGAHSDEVLKRLKCVHDHGDMVARVIWEDSRVREGLLMFSESRCADPYIHGNIAIKVDLRRYWGGVADSQNLSLIVWKPLHRRRELLPVDDSLLWRDFAVGDGTEHGPIVRDDTVLVGVREEVNKKEGIEPRVFLSVERLQAFDDVFPMNNTQEHSWGVSGVFGEGFHNWELMAFSKLDPGACLDKSRDNIVQRGPQVVYEVPQDNADSRLFEIARAQHDGIAAAVLVEFKAGSVRVSFLDNRINFSIEGVQVFVRPCDLCV